MTTFAFLILPIHGHLNPTFPVACELIRRGQRVTYWVPEQFRPAAEATGAAVRTYMARPLVSVSAGGSVSAIAAMLLEDPSPVLDQLVPRVRSEMPDVVVHDSLCLWSILGCADHRSPGRGCPTDLRGQRRAQRARRGLHGCLDLATDPTSSQGRRLEQESG